MRNARAAELLSLLNLDIVQSSFYEWADEYEVREGRADECDVDLIPSRTPARESGHEL